MDRKYEILLVLKDLFKKISEETKNNIYTTNEKVLIKSADEVVRLSKLVNIYTDELKSLM